MVVSSGNGWHIVYRTTRGSAAHNLRSVGGSSTCPVRRLLRRFAMRFDTNDVRIDTTVSNPARLVRLPGTPARKGTPTAERPHRYSQVLHVPDGWRPGPRTGDPIPALDLPNEPDPPPVAAAVGYTGSAPADAVTRAVAYLAALPASVQGANGSGALMAAARAACWGFALGPDVGLKVLRDFFNPRAVPPWSEAALTRVCERAMIDAERPFSYLLLTNGGGR